MAINVKERISPTVTVPSAAGNHTSGELCMEMGKIGVATVTCTTGQPMVLIEHGIVTLPVAGSAGAIATGVPIYAVGNAHVNGDTLQAMSSTYRSTAVTGTLTATATSNTLVGTTVGPSRQEGATVVADIELKPQ